MLILGFLAFVFWPSWALPKLVNWGMRGFGPKGIWVKLMVKLDHKNEVGGVPYEPTV